jgi:hypothetical protein
MNGQGLWILAEELFSLRVALKTKKYSWDMTSIAFLNLYNNTQFANLSTNEPEIICHIDLEMTSDSSELML